MDQSHTQETWDMNKYISEYNIFAEQRREMKLIDKNSANFEYLEQAYKKTQKKYPTLETLAEMMCWF